MFASVKGEKIILNYLYFVVSYLIVFDFPDQVDDFLSQIPLT